MDKTYICRRVPNDHNYYLEMLIYQQLENGIEAVVGSVKFSYDEDCIDLEIAYGNGKIFYRRMDFFSRDKRFEFSADKLGGREIAAECRPTISSPKHCLQWSNGMLYVRCDCTKEGKGCVIVFDRDPAGKKMVKPFLQIQPQLHGKDLYWSARIPGEYSQELCMILATLPLSFNAERFMYTSWLGI